MTEPKISLTHTESQELTRNSRQNKKPKILTQSRLKELLFYNQHTGLFTWLTRVAQRVHIGDIAGCLDARGYVKIFIDGKSYTASRLAFLYMEGYFPENQVDHKDRVKHNNKWENLREVSFSCNMRNKSVYRNNSTGVTGVSWDKRNEKWHSQIQSNKIKIHLGFHETFLDAVKARWTGEKEHKFSKCCFNSLAYNYLKERGLI